uniref:ubiquitinyl hydrolase 1 n=1 Tax=Oncorhynchus mykiss TaxID=8022 RepID=A0A8C7R5Q7_ONCMY
WGLMFYQSLPFSNISDLVISTALSVWGLELTLFNSREYQRLMINPINEKAFICNYMEHWFTIRKLGQQLVKESLSSCRVFHICDPWKSPRV